MICISTAVTSVTPCSLAQATQPLSTVGRKMRGTFSSISSASSVKWTAGSVRSAAYRTEEREALRMGSSSGTRRGVLANQKFLLSR